MKTKMLALALILTILLAVPLNATDINFLADAEFSADAESQINPEFLRMINEYPETMRPPMFPQEPPRESLLGGVGKFFSKVWWFSNGFCVGGGVIVTIILTK